MSNQLQKAGGISAIITAASMDENEYKLSIEKEVLNEYVAGMSAKYFHAAKAIGVLCDSTHPIKVKEKEIFALKDAVRDAKPWRNWKP
jgi:hypothetical protein